MTGTEPDQLNQRSPRFFYGYIIVAICFLMVAMTMGTYFSIGVFIKPMIAELGWSRALISGALSTAWIVSGLLSIVIGGLNDRFGPRIILTVCVSLYGLGFLLLSRVSAVWQLYLYFGLLIGLGMSFFVPTASTIIRWFVRRRTLMIGIFLTGGGVGMLVFPQIATQLILAYDWHLSYIIIGSIFLFITIIGAQFLKRDPAQIGQKPYGADEKPGDISYSESRSFSVRDALATWQLWVFLLMQVCVGITIHSIMVHIAPHATDVGISPEAAAGILSIIGIITIAGRIVLGSAGDRLGNVKVLVVCFALMLISFIWLLYAKDTWHFYLFAVIFGLAFGGCVTQQAPLVAVLFGLSSYGVILAVVGFGYTMGSAAGPFLAGYLFDLTASYHTAFMVFAGIALIGMMLTVLLRPPTPKSAAETDAETISASG